MKPWHTKYLWRNDGRRCGKICIRGHRLALTDILREAIHGEGMDYIARVKSAWPDLTKWEIEAAMELIFDLADAARNKPNEAIAES
jgi:uncharacterized protein (DUF433 family)